MSKRIVASAFFVLASFQAQAAERPPQFVAMAFDNCTELERWKELSDFAAAMNEGGDRLHFTFFVSGSNFIADDDRNSYASPLGRGLSRIGFGGSAEDVARRIEFASDLVRRGHEIASHAVGHFNGAGWPAETWRQEFRAFERVLGAAKRLDGAGHFPLRAAGFRAPYLAASADLYPVLREFGFRYDTSGSGEPNAWPQKIGGIWRFNLARLRLHRSTRATLSMDYNFFVLQSRAVDDPRHYELFRDQILQTYLDYFRANYHGNRAPLHIGHHFFDYQGGAYKEALKSFAREVCGLAEVRCVTYSALADFLDAQSEETLAAFQKGDFPHYAEARAEAALAHDASRRDAARLPPEDGAFAR
ncbi:MAG TPA: polysaccharide deacetylase family protein [Pseudorhodoplanes sp.]|nr:polysaccharide deacetylase family protein [Pseudorhodoplanes sp.]